MHEIPGAMRPIGRGELAARNYLQANKWRRAVRLHVAFICATLAVVAGSVLWLN